MTTEETTPAKKTELDTLPLPSGDVCGSSLYFNPALADRAKGIAKMLSESDFVPPIYKNKPGNCFIALEYSARLGVSPMALIQSSGIVNGKPAIEAKLLIAIINSRKIFATPFSWVITGEGDNKKCVCSVTTHDGEELVDQLTVKQVKDCGWWDKSGSYWPKLTDLMLKYRTASFLIKVHKPELILGIPILEEEKDISKEEVPSESSKLKAILNKGEK